MHKKIIRAKVVLKAGQVGAFVAAAKIIITASRAESGCISYTLLQDPFDQTVFYFFEEWKNKKAIDLHFATPHFKAFGVELKAMVSGPPAITVYTCPREHQVGR